MKLGKFSFIIGYLLLHVSALVFEIRQWPLTDYPMFGKAFEPYEQFSVFRFRAIGPDRKGHWLPRNLTPRIKTFDLEMDRAAYSGNWDQVKGILRQYALLKPGEWRKYSSIQLISRKATRAGDGSFAVEDLPVAEFDVRELIQNE